MVLPPFTTERLRLRGVMGSDLEALRALWAKPEVRRYLFEDKLVTPELASRALESCLACVPRGLGLWVVQRRSERGIIGCVGVLPTASAAEYDPRLKGLVELVVAFSPDVWGNGYAQEALRAVVEYGFTSLRLPTIAGVNDVPNEASERMFRRLGFAFRGECDGPSHRLRTYSLEREAFESVLVAKGAGTNRSAELRS